MLEFSLTFVKVPTWRSPHVPLIFHFQLAKLTVVVLKEYLTSVGKKMTGRKQELIDAIMDHLGILKS